MLDGSAVRRHVMTGHLVSCIHPQMSGNMHTAHMLGWQAPQTTKPALKLSIKTDSSWTAGFACRLLCSIASW